MRKIGDLEKKEDCDRFTAYLRSKKIDSEVREGQSSGFGIWVYDEDQLEEAEKNFQRFCASPEAVEFSLAELKSFLSTPKAVSKSPKKIVYSPTNDILFTWCLMGICLAITILVQVPQLKLLIYRYLFFSVNILEGQVWRLVTPALIHSDLLHFIFNMFWLYDLGGDVEREEGPKFYLAFFIIVAMLCNIAQFFVSGPAFNGMSGVVYGLVGYVWMMTRYSPASRYGISDAMMLFMVCWIFVGLVLPGMHIANTQHITGIVLGLVLGSMRSGHLKNSWRQFRRK
jgi:GlpG protein